MRNTKLTGRERLMNGGEIVMYFDNVEEMFNNVSREVVEKFDEEKTIDWENIEFFNGFKTEIRVVAKREDPITNMCKVRFVIGKLIEEEKTFRGFSACITEMELNAVTNMFRI